MILSSISLHVQEEYSPDIPLMFKTSLTHSFPLPLTGEVVCQISGCYEDRDTFTQYLIPVFSFPCLPPPPPPPNSSESAFTLGLYTHALIHNLHAS